MSMFTLYLLTVLVKVGVVSQIIVFFGALAFSVIALFLFLAEGIEEFKLEIKPIFKIWLVITLFFALLSVTIPSIKEIAFIYVVGKTTQNEQLQDMPDKAFEILSLKLEEYIQDLKQNSN